MAEFTTPRTVSVRLRLFGCVCLAASVWLRQFGCVCLAASVWLRLIGRDADLVKTTIGIPFEARYSDRKEAAE
jgi:hypothetical protein